MQVLVVSRCVDEYHGGDCNKLLRNVDDTITADGVIVMAKAFDLTFSNTYTL